MLPKLLPYLLLSLAAHAGSVQTNVQVCGVTTIYERFGEQELAILGFSDSGVVDQFFKIKGYLNIEESPSSSNGDKASAISDFISITTLNGVKLCARGNLETSEHNENTTYFLAPRWFKLDEQNAGNLLLPSQLPGAYVVQTATNPGFALAATTAPETGLRFEFVGMASYLVSMLGSGACAALDRATANGTLLSFVPKRLDRGALAGDVVVACDPTSSTAANTIALHFEFRRSEKGGPITGLMRVEYPATNTHFQAKIRN